MEERKPISVVAKASEIITGVSKRGQLTKRDDWSGCKAVQTQGPWTSAGIQTMVANTQTCTASSCSFTISQGVSVSSTLTSENSQSFETSFGGSISVEAGFDLLVTTSVTFTATFGFASTIATSTSQSVQNTTTITVTNNLGQPGGTTAFATFTPTYHCWRASMDCGAGVSQPLTFCNPQFENLGSQQILQGEYNIVYIG